MESQQIDSLSEGLRFVIFSCWLAVVVCCAELLPGFYDKPGDIIEIVFAGLSLYVALGIKSRSNPARLVLVVLLAAGAASTVVMPAIRIVQAIFGSWTSASQAETFAFFALYLVAPLLMMRMYFDLFREVLDDRTRKQFAVTGEAAGEERSGREEELTKEKTAAWIGAIVGLVSVLLQI